MKIYFSGYKRNVIIRWSDRLLKHRHPDDWVMRTPEAGLELFVERTEDAINWILNHTINPLINLIPERIKYVSVDYYDTWNLDATLAQVIRPCLEKFVSNLHSYPSEEMEDDVIRIAELSARTTEYDTVLLPEGDADDVNFEYWKIIINEMIWAFKHAENDEWQWNPPYMMDTHTFDFDAIRSVQNRIENGLQMFAKYYFNLWD